MKLTSDESPVPKFERQLADSVLVEEEINAYIIAPKRFLDAKTFAKVAEAVKQRNGDFVWLRKGRYYFRIPKGEK